MRGDLTKFKGVNNEGIYLCQTNLRLVITTGHKNMDAPRLMTNTFYSQNALLCSDSGSFFIESQYYFKVREYSTEIGVRRSVSLFFYSRV